MGAKYISYITDLDAPLRVLYDKVRSEDWKKRSPVASAIGKAADGLYAKNTKAGYVRSAPLYRALYNLSSDPVSLALETSSYLNLAALAMKGNNISEADQYAAEAAANNKYLYSLTLSPSTLEAKQKSKALLIYDDKVGMFFYDEKLPQKTIMALVEQGRKDWASLTVEIKKIQDWAKKAKDAANKGTNAPPKPAVSSQTSRSGLGETTQFLIIGGVLVAALALYAMWPKKGPQGAA